MRDLWLIRHAESVANAGETTSTPREIPLSADGREQARLFAAAAGERPDLIVVSPYVRTHQTAEPLIELYPDADVEEMLVQEFTYLSVTRCRGTNFQQRKPWVSEYWERADPFYADGGQAESFAQLIGRCVQFERQIAEREFELAFVFTHEQFIKGLLWRSLQTAVEMTSDLMRSYQKFMTSFTVPNTAVVRVKLDTDRRFYFGSIETVVIK